MNQIILILKYKLITFFKISSSFTFESLFKNLGSFIVYGAFALGSFVFAQRVIGYLLVNMRLGDFLLHEFISMILFIFFISINVGNIIVSYSTLFKSEEVAYLLTKPIFPTKIFVIKFLDNFFYSSSTLLLILFAVLAGYSVYFDLSLLEFISLIGLNFFPFMFSAASLGVIILMIILKLAERFGVKKILYTIVGGYLTIVFLFFNISSPVDLVNEVFKHYPNVNEYFGNLIPPEMKFLPNYWLSRSLYWISKGEINESIKFFAIQCGVSVFLFSLAVYLGHKWYQKSWFVSLKLRSKMRKMRELDGTKSILTKSFFLSPFNDSLIKKDFLLFIREPSQIVHFIVLMVLIFVFMFSISGVALIAGSNVYLQSIIYLILFIFNALLISTLSLRFVFPLISLEGLASWKIRSAPVGLSKYIRAKLLPFFLIILFISELLAFFTSRDFSINLIFVNILVNFFITTSLVALNFGMGGLFSVYREKNPIRIASSQGASLTFLLCMIYMLFVLIFLFIPVSNYFYSLMINKIESYSYFTSPVIVIILISIVITGLFYQVGYTSLKKDF
ncbi:MAG: hypothetical protein K9J16_01285 [Melioribacteraceae bacterium]|nr:hypothetical protein [Melioribacteraceae bacterium]MCF8352856.1 hypothetical protein [Melioribacteraceae bacterium]MCF8393827.1 hypothetical protein [Melioribacteraceae bacterium]MCF8417373.1 hypothetical protein [Melioribacteraceae bacterium]